MRTGPLALATGATAALAVLVAACGGAAPSAAKSPKVVLHTSAPAASPICPIVMAGLTEMDKAMNLNLAAGTINVNVPSAPAANMTQLTTWLGDLESGGLSVAVWSEYKDPATKHLRADMVTLASGLTNLMIKHDTAAADALITDAQAVATDCGQ